MASRLRFWDSWEFRAWVLWMPCAIRKHRGVFELESRWHFPDCTSSWTMVRCSCGRRMKRAEVTGG